MGDKEPRRPFGAEPQDERVPGLSPVRAFFIVGALAAVVPLGLLATRSDEAPPEPGRVERSPDFSLTDAEAIERFNELHDLFRSASKTRDMSVVKLMLVSGSRLSQTAHVQIRQLIRDGVLDRSRFLDQEVRVVTNTPTRIEIEQEVTVRPRFVSDRTGRDVTLGAPLRQTVHWVLVPEAGAWKVLDSKVIRSERLR